MVRIEHYIDNVFRGQARPAEEVTEYGYDLGAAGAAAGSPRLEHMVARFGQSVAQLEKIVAHFDTALQNFSSSTRDFREFNLHLKDNIQRMSLSFADLSETLKAQASALRPRDPR
jgi:hypothetical protein